MEYAPYVLGKSALSRHYWSSNVEKIGMRRMGLNSILLKRGDDYGIYNI
jgi:hypothetical protein